MENLNKKELKTLLCIYNKVDVNDSQNFKNQLTKLLEVCDDIILKDQNLNHRQSIHKKMIDDLKYYLKLSTNRFGMNALSKYYNGKFTQWFKLNIKGPNYAK